MEIHVQELNDKIIINNQNTASTDETIAPCTEDVPLIQSQCVCRLKQTW